MAAVFTKVYSKNIYRAFSFSKRFFYNVFESRLVSETTTNCLSKFTSLKCQPSYFRRMHTSLKCHSEIVQFKLADIGEGIAEVQITEWYVKEGDIVKEFDQVCEVKSDKASVTITSRYNGVIKKLYYETDEEAYVGKPLVDIEVNSESRQTTEPITMIPEPVATASETFETLPPLPKMQVSSANSNKSNVPLSPTVYTGYEGRSIVPTTPAVRKIAKENQINLSDVPATGKDGRVLKEDVLKFIEKHKSDSSTNLPSCSLPFSTNQTEDKILPLKGLQKVMFKTMQASLSIPHFGYCDEVDVTELTQLRKDLKELCKERGVKLSFMPFFLKAASMALLKYPILNATLDAQQTNVIFKKSHNIGVAMDTKDGLLVPNIKEVQLKSIFEICEELNRLHELGMKGKIGPTDMLGTTFTISNIGSIGGTYAHPVISPPQVAIGALGKIQTVPRYDSNGNLVKVNIFNVSWSADHRIIDGATMARFSNLWKSHLENPFSMILDLK
ncbi:lipoamide acyltransferase component of branched-chain alpha-keto acid dehydrogenase complex, mitochondrial isoform X1 [Hydra vulgaris]|uniref:lipoamide acyltransferase component of branched-chain alpha-keto acid dehydrogenase complex, mitochondrial isoform X1 n=2 Tax=Hydra vulgaris TaxID=6087 RepID=UPI0006410B28|nr:lipoamide acyltransferase component of branched-chain alpha-keto acid dehydrogenase complex, mitochondrial isoform X1 [Hydra vulgaris]